MNDSQPITATTALATIPGNDVARGSIARQEFGASELAMQAETSATATAAAARAEIEAAFIVALQRPRSMDRVFERIMAECKRPSFARAARYSLPPRGDDGKRIEGPSIRFVESALRAMGNNRTTESIVYDDADKQIVAVVAMDLETNTAFATSVVVSKTVERRFVKEGMKVISSRVNSQGKKVYLVPATEEEMRQKRAAEVSRVSRNVGKKLIPADIVEDAMARCIKVQLDEAAKDPEGERKSIILAFSDIGVSAEEVGSYVGHALDRLQPAELVELRGLYRSISDGHTTWEKVLAERAAALAAKAPAPEGAPAAGSKKTAAEKLRERVTPPAAAAPAAKPQREPGDDDDAQGVPA